MHVRSFSTTGSSTTALWVNRDLAQTGTDDISSVLKLKRVEPCEAAKTAEGRRHRKEMAIHTVEEDIGVSAKSLQLEQIRSIALRGEDALLSRAPFPSLKSHHPPIPSEVHVPTDSSASDCIKHEDSESSTISLCDDFVSTSAAANMLLMLSRS